MTMLIVPCVISGASPTPTDSELDAGLVHFTRELAQDHGAEVTGDIRIVRLKGGFALRWVREHLASPDNHDCPDHARHIHNYDQNEAALRDGAVLLIASVPVNPDKDSQ